jgi:hypothetical protein
MKLKPDQEKLKISSQHQMEDDALLLPGPMADYFAG